MPTTIAPSQTRSQQGSQQRGQQDFQSQDYRDPGTQATVSQTIDRVERQLNEAQQSFQDAISKMRPVLRGNESDFQAQSWQVNEDPNDPPLVHRLARIEAQARNLQSIAITLAERIVV